jgi:hypothetical protein
VTIGIVARDECGHDLAAVDADGLPMNQEIYDITHLTQAELN